MINTFCRAKTICGKVQFTVRIIKSLFCSNNLLSGLACLNLTFSSLSKVVFIWVKSDYAQNVITTGAHKNHVSIRQNTREDELIAFTFLTLIDSCSWYPCTWFHLLCRPRTEMGFSNIYFAIHPLPVLHSSLSNVWKHIEIACSQSNQHEMTPNKL